MKLTVVGWFGERNVGDEAFREVFEQQFAGHDLKFVQRAKAGHEKPDLIVFGGGGVVCGGYLADIPPGVPKIALGVDMALDGPDYERWYDLDFDMTFLRSREYAALSQGLLRDVRYCPDLAFALPVPTRAKKPPGKPRLGITLSERLRGSKVEHHLLSALTKLQGEYTYCLLPFYDGKNSDAKAHAEFVTGFTEIEDLGWSSTTAEQLKKVQSLDALLTMRFHGTIFATLTGTPFLAISSKGKDSLFCEQEDLHPYHLELNGLNHYRVLDRLLRFKHEGYGMSFDLRTIAENNKKDVDAVFKAIRGRYLT